MSFSGCSILAMRERVRLLLLLGFDFPHEQIVPTWGVVTIRQGASGATISLQLRLGTSVSQDLLPAKLTRPLIDGERPTERGRRSSRGNPRDLMEGLRRGQPLRPYFRAIP